MLTAFAVACGAGLMASALWAAWLRRATRRRGGYGALKHSGPIDDLDPIEAGREPGRHSSGVRAAAAWLGLLDEENWDDDDYSRSFDDGSYLDDGERDVAPAPLSREAMSQTIADSPYRADLERVAANVDTSAAAARISEELWCLFAALGPPGGHRGAECVGNGVGGGGNDAV
jgi:hypothetical protein